jgi:hypothetical protein
LGNRCDFNAYIYAWRPQKKTATKGRKQMEVTTFACDVCGDDIKTGFFVDNFSAILEGRHFAKQVIEDTDHVCSDCLFEEFRKMGIMK